MKALAILLPQLVLAIVFILKGESANRGDFTRTYDRGRPYYVIGFCAALTFLSSTLVWLLT
jgi:hypothetical protein